MSRYRNVSILAAAIFVQILGLAVQVKRPTENRSSRLIRVWAVTTFTPIEKSIVRLESGLASVWHNYFYLRGVRQENRGLRDQLEQLKLEEVRLKQDAEQARRLQALLGFKEQFIAKTTAAQVIGSSGSEQSRTIYIDKGSRDGIQPDMAVIATDGVVGKVIAAFGGASQVLLISDQQSGVGAILEQTRLQGVLKGRASGELVLDKIMADEEVKVGEKVLTSGGDQIFPKGLAIGSVEKVRKGPEFLQVMVKPGARLNHLEEVLVILKKEERQVPVSNPGGVRAADILAERLPAVPDKPLQRASPSAASGGTQRTNSSPASAHGLAIENRTAGAKPRADTSEAATSPSGAAPAEPKTPAVAAPKPADNAPAGDTNKSAPPARDETAPESRGEAPH